MVNRSQVSPIDMIYAAERGKTVMYVGATHAEARRQFNKCKILLQDEKADTEFNVPNLIIRLNYAKGILYFKSIENLSESFKGFQLDEVFFDANMAPGMEVYVDKIDTSVKK